MHHITKLNRNNHQIIYTFIFLVGFLCVYFLRVFQLESPLTNAKTNQNQKKFEKKPLIFKLLIGSFVCFRFLIFRLLVRFISFFLLFFPVGVVSFCFASSKFLVILLLNFLSTQIQFWKHHMYTHIKTRTCIVFSIESG